MHARLHCESTNAPASLVVAGLDPAINPGSGVPRWLDHPVKFSDMARP